METFCVSLYILKASQHHFKDIFSSTNLTLNHHLVLGHPLPNPGHNCAFLDSAGQHTWQSASCAKKLGYICYKDGAPPTHPQSTGKILSIHTLLMYCFLM